MEKRGGSGRACCPGLQVSAALEGQLLHLALGLYHLSVSAFPLPLPLLRSADDHPPLAEVETESQGSETAHSELAWGRVSSCPRFVWLPRPLL